MVASGVGLVTLKFCFALVFYNMLCMDVCWIASGIVCVWQYPVECANCCPHTNHAVSNLWFFTSCLYLCSARTVLTIRTAHATLLPHHPPSPFHPPSFPHHPPPSPCRHSLLPLLSPISSLSFLHSPPSSLTTLPDQGILSFLCAPLIGALSDAWGRKSFLLLTVFFTCAPIPVLLVDSL